MFTGLLDRGVETRAALSKQKGAQAGAAPAAAALLPLCWCQRPGELAWGLRDGQGMHVVEEMAWSRQQLLLTVPLLSHPW